MKRSIKNTLIVLTSASAFLPVISASCENGTIKAKEVAEVHLPDNFDIKKLNSSEKRVFKKANSVNLNSVDYTKGTTFEIPGEKDYFLKIYSLTPPSIDENTVVPLDKDKEVSAEINLEFKIIYKDPVENAVELVDGWEKKLSIKNDKFILHSLNSVYNSFESNKASAFEFKNIDWDKLKAKYFDAEIVKWSDGDTPVVKVTSVDPLNQNVKVGDETKIRISGVDTPEKFVGGIKSSNLEHNYALLSSKFAEEALPKGSKVRVYGDSKDAYGRIVGDVFFGDKYQYLYSVEITRSGLTLPYYDNITLAFSFVKNPVYWEHYALLRLGEALEYAKTNKKGFFKTFALPYWIQSNIYKMKPNGKWTLLDKHSPTNLYNIEGINLIDDSYKNK
ncbi:thermonuclease family protein [Mycoplasmopsis bovis]|uniref:thermonuclease family protein n=1 Tax=Mycoplasmopsis bovis TaxID=28903 RepID=UPI003CFFDDFD